LNRTEFNNFAENLLAILEAGPNGATVRKQYGVDTPAQFAEKLFNNSDQNKDNEISFAEFKAVVLTF
jgi:Ca2+-binding EF-hand superfamily protein